MVSETFTIETDDDLNRLRQALREYAENCKFSDYEVTKLVTAASEISRNILNFAEVGDVTIEVEDEEPDQVRAIFSDDGPGIEDVDRAMEDGYSGEESDGLGVGLPGAKRLTDEFEVDSSPVEGTTITLVVYREQLQ